MVCYVCLFAGAAALGPSDVPAEVPAPRVSAASVDMVGAYGLGTAGDDAAGFGCNTVSSICGGIPSRSEGPGPSPELPVDVKRRSIAPPRPAVMWTWKRTLVAGATRHLRFGILGA